MRELKTSGSTYKFLKVMGEGQSATVFRAIREDSEGYSRQTVALKVLRSRDDVRVLRREFETLMRVSSPHCVRALGWENFVEGHAGPALVLEWIDGVTLAELARGIQLDHRQIDELIAQLQEGLRTLHRQGLHHGDLSPANVLIDSEGCAKLVDFASVPRESDTIIGTPAFLAPEIWSGAQADGPADLFSLGVIEHDLRAGNSFSELAQASIEECRARSLRLTKSEGSPRLRLSPAARDPRALNSCEEQRRRLAESVRILLAARERLIPATAEIRAVSAKASEPEILPEIRSRRPRQIAYWAMAALCALALPVRAKAPMDRGESPGVHACLSIRSQNWLKIAINGHDMGYAPIETHHLTPGPQRISWRSQYLHGESRIEVGSGPCQHLSEANLRLLGAPGNH